VPILLKIDQEMRPWECSQTRSHTHTDRCKPIFTAPHGMQTRCSDEKAVRSSEYLSVCPTRDLWQNGRKISPDFYTIRKII